MDLPQIEDGLVLQYLGLFAADQQLRDLFGFTVFWSGEWGSEATVPSHAT